jgi:hypothetical protein
MRTVVAFLAGAVLVAAAFGVGRVTRADAGAPVVAPIPTPEPLAPATPVSAPAVSAGKTIPALRPVPTPKPKKQSTTSSSSSSATPSGSGSGSGTTSTGTAPPAATTAPSSSGGSTTSSPPPAKKQPSKSKPVEEIG